MHILEMKIKNVMTLIILVKEKDNSKMNLKKLKWIEEKLIASRIKDQQNQNLYLKIIFLKSL